MYNPRMNAGIDPRMGQGFDRMQSNRMQPGNDPFQKYGFPPMDQGLQPMSPMDQGPMNFPSGGMGMGPDMPRTGGGFRSPVSQNPGFATPPMQPDLTGIRSRRPQTNRMPPRGREPVF